jgi:stage V sporulation protein SpoVS
MKYGQENIRALNDKLRSELTGGAAVMTTGVAALGVEAVNRAIKAISVFDDFCEKNDPYQEHDFGVIDIEGQKVFFKIDYYDKSRNMHSPDPSDPDVTERVLTIMLAEEY